MPKSQADDIRQDITSRIVEALESGTAPWRKPWSSDPNSGWPTNIVSKNRYRGVNPLLLEITAMNRGYRSKWWASYKQWRELGGQVRKGEKGTRICFYKTLAKEEANDDGDTKSRKVFFLRTYSVFNLDQVASTQDGDKDRLAKFRPGPDDDAKAALFANWKPAEMLCRATGADIRHLGGDRACYYRPTPIGSWPDHDDGDYIELPHRNQFPVLQDYYGTKLHELIHWSEIRRSWEGSYALGELIAEIGGCYLSSALNVPQSDDLENHERYLASWLKEMGDDPKWIFKASQEASNAADFILGFAEQNQEQPETVSVA